MSYYIDIIDTLSPLVQIVLKSAAAKGIILEWNGGDKKDDKTIIGSNLFIDMLSLNDDDGAFVEFFTGDEHRFKTLVKSSVDDSIIWQGYILPDLYSEPYKQVNFFVGFTASDGLGRLKGKYLTDDYYSEEKSVIDIFCQILKLTGLEMELYFAPAIENYLEKDWNKIYIDTANFSDKNKKQDAYKIFETLLNDTGCICYQCDNRWYIEGINVRHLRKVMYKIYDTLGNLSGTVVFDRLVKQITALATPLVTIIPPYNEVVVSSKKNIPEIPKTASKEVNGGWAVTTGETDGVIDASAWMANGDYYAKCTTPGYGVVIYNQYYFDHNEAPVWEQDDTKYVSLRNKVYFSNRDKVKFTLGFKIVKRDDSFGDPSDPENWHNVLKYEIIFNGVVLYSNFGGLVETRENLRFDTGGQCKIEIDHIFDAEGLLNIKLYRPTGRVFDNGVLGVELTEVSAEIINFNEDVIETDLINGDFTIDKEIEITYSDDKTGFSKGFRLAKLKESTGSYNEIPVYVLYSFPFEGKIYTVVSLEGANLIKNNKYQVFYESEPVTVLDVIYNLDGGEQMAIQTLVPYVLGDFFIVRKYAVDDVVSSRNHWEQWTDSFYKIENNSYLKTVANIFRRMFNVAHEKLELTAKNAVKFNDIIPFKYEFMKDFVVLNCTWYLDGNYSNLVLGRANYKDSEGIGTGENIPPIVVACDDIFITESDSVALISATAYDPDGFIASQVWTKISGDGGDVIVDPVSLSTTLTNLTGDSYTYQIEVTDNSGATAVDFVNILRAKDYVVTLDLVEESVNPQEPQLLMRKYKLNVTPSILPNYSLLFNGEFHLYARGGYKPSYTPIGRVQKAMAFCSITKNGAMIQNKELISDNWQDKYVKDQKFLVSDLRYISTDEIFITVGSWIEYRLVDVAGYYGGSTFHVLSKQQLPKAITNFDLQTVQLATGIGTVTGTPINVKTELKLYDQ